MHVSAERDKTEGILRAPERHLEQFGAEPEGKAGYADTQKLSDDKMTELMRQNNGREDNENRN